MKHINKVVFGGALLALCGIAQADEADIRKSFAENMPEVKLGAITKTPYGGLYQVVVNGSNIAYTDEKGQVALVGNMLELTSKTNLTQVERENLSVIDFSTLPLDKAIVRVKGTGARKMAIFSDPECPFCQGLETQLEALNDVTIYTFLLPLTDIHPQALHKAEMIWCAKDKAQAWDDMLLRQQEPKDVQAGCETPIKELAAYAKSHSITGTPGIVFPSGKMLFGNQPMEKVAKLLDENHATP